MKYTPEAETFYNAMNTFTEAVENGTTDIENIITFCMNYKEALKTETIEQLESLAEKYVTDIVPDMLIIIDCIKRDLKGEFKDIQQEDTEEIITAET